MDEKTIARFWSKVDVRGPDECWMWVASKDGGGYGWFAGCGSGRGHSAHRVSWALANGPIPVGSGYHGTCVLHRCDVRLCVNPAHLFLGTAADNMTDKAAKGRASRLRGEANGQARLTEETVASIRSDRARGMSERRLAAKYGISRSHTHAIVSGKRRQVAGATA